MTLDRIAFTLMIVSVLLIVGSIGMVFASMPIAITMLVIGFLMHLSSYVILFWMD